MKFLEPVLSKKNDHPEHEILGYILSVLDPELGEISDFCFSEIGSEEQ